MWSYPISHYASFLFDGDGQGHPVSEKELRDTAARLATALWKRGFDVGDIFGSSTDLWAFADGTGACEILADLSPPEMTFDNDGDCRCCFSIRAGSRLRANDVLQK